MAFEIPVDVDYFDHPKTKKLCLALKKPEGDIYPLRLWKWCAKYAKDGILPADVALIEAELGWKGAPGRLHGCLMGSGFIESDGVTVHDWMWHIGRAIAIYEAKKQKQREKYDKERGIIPEEVRKNSGSNTPTQDTQDTQDTQLRKPHGSVAASPTLATLQGALDGANGAASRGVADSKRDRGDIKHLNAAKDKANLFESVEARTRALEFIGYLENNELITYPAIAELMCKVWSFRQGLTFSDGVPADRIVKYALGQAMKARAFNASYIGKVIQTATIKYREDRNALND
jgi:hypothetical protein